MDNKTAKTVDLHNKIYLDKGQITIDGVPLKHIQRFFMVGIYNSLFFVIIFLPINILFFKYTKIKKKRAILFFYDHLEFRFRPF